MKRVGPEGDARAAQAGSPIALVLIDLLADRTSALYSSLRVCDLFCVRLTCKEAWRMIHHKVLTRNNLWRTALNLGSSGSIDEMREPHVPMLRWCTRQALSTTEFTAKCIGATGDMTLMDEFLDRHPRSLLVQLIAGAARSGRCAEAVELLNRIVPDELYRFHASEMKRDVSAGGLVEVAKLIYQTPSWLSADSVALALRKGHLSFAQWALDESTLDSIGAERAVVLAAESGSMDLVQWLVSERGCPVSSPAVASAATAGDLDMLRWLHGQVGGDLQSVLTAATRHDHVHVLEWLVEQGCSLTEELMYVAAEASDAATVAWLLDQGCSYVEETLVLRSCMNRWTGSTFQYLAEAKRMQYSPSACTEAASDKLWFVDSVLHRVHGAPLSDRHVVDCVHSGDIERLRNALQHEAPLGRNALTVMINNRECAMLSETLEHHLVDENLPDDVFSLIDEALSFARPVSHDIVQVLGRVGCDVPGKGGTPGYRLRRRRDR